MNSLSTEIFNQISAHITECRDHLSLRAVNRAFYVKFTPIAFGFQRIRNTKASATRFARLSLFKIAEWVIDLHIDLLVRPDAPSEVDALDRHEIPRADLTAFTHVKSLFLRFPGWHRSCNFKRRVRDTALTAFASGAMSPTSLTIVGMRCDCYQSITKSPGFRRFFRRLTYLCLEVDTCSTFLENFLTPAQNTLETLVLRANAEKPEFFVAAKLSKLKKLELRNFHFTESKVASVESFLLSQTVSRNLEELSILDCTFEVERGLRVKRRWANVLQAIQRDLLKLTRFTIAHLSYLNIHRGVYAVYPYTRRATMSSSHDEPSPTEYEHLMDVMALNQLWESIDAADRMEPGDERYFILERKENSVAKEHINYEHENVGSTLDALLGVEYTDITPLEVAMREIDEEEEEYCRGF